MATGGADRREGEEGLIGEPAIARTQERRTAGYRLRVTIGRMIVLCQPAAMTSTDTLSRIANAAAEKGDFTHARECYERGAALNDFLCLHSLGYMYDVGEGVVEDKAVAMKLYRKAWALGSHASAANIAILYRQQSRRRTMFRWYERVALAGDGSARLDIAKCYLNGIGVRKNVQAALRNLVVAVASDYITECEREEAQALLQSLRPQLAR